MMSAVLDILRTHLLGDEVATQLDQVLSVMVSSVTANSATNRATAPLVTQPAAARALPANSGLEAMLTPSRGYEPFLMDSGFNQLAARGIAKIAVRQGKRRAKESKLHRPVLDAIRFLAKSGRQRRALRRRADLLLWAWNNSSIIETTFDEAGYDATEFIGLLRCVVEGKAVDCQRIAEIAAGVTPNLTLSRGPKISASSAAHEFLLREPRIMNCARRRARSREIRRAEYVGPLTEATRLEFGIPDFDPRPARRRLKRLKAVAN